MPEIRHLLGLGLSYPDLKLNTEQMDLVEWGVRDSLVAAVGSELKQCVSVQISMTNGGYWVKVAFKSREDTTVCSGDVYFNTVVGRLEGLGVKLPNLLERLTFRGSSAPVIFGYDLAPKS